MAFGMAEGVIGVAGPPGAGKSTLLATFATLRRPHSGALRILGHDIGTARGLRAARARIGFLPGRFQWARNMTTEELVTYAAYYKRVRAPAARDIMKRLDVADSSRTELGLLPPDVRLRAGLAAACVHDPELVVLDDPLDELYARRTTADEAALAELIPLIRSLAPTVVVSGAQPEHLAPWCREVHTLARGRLTRYPPRPAPPTALLPSAPRVTSARRTASASRATSAPRAPTSAGGEPAPSFPVPAPNPRPLPCTVVQAPETPSGPPHPPGALPQPSPHPIDHAGKFVQTCPSQDARPAVRAGAAAHPAGGEAPLPAEKQAVAVRPGNHAGRRPARSGAGV
ncbi:ATP-binding cassette domain-containing protein [Actinomadura sp. SCN-SB]|uniref:ATP-binding cassette domain-containing protein n=1 Tax=Actinomadura sp. SCN-SB TaxID=3373092 RepID=UPI00375315CA